MAGVLMLCAVEAAAAPSGAGLEERWHYDAFSPAAGIPLAADLAEGEALEILVPTRYDGALIFFDARGKMLRRAVAEHWIAGSAAFSPQGRHVAYEDNAGYLVLVDHERDRKLKALIDGRVLPFGSVCFGDLNADGSHELVVVRQDGLVSALDNSLTPCWQFDGGVAINAPVAIAPVFNDTAGVYCTCADGAVIALSGHGAPLWRRELAVDGEAPRVSTPPIVVQLGVAHPVVLATTESGLLTAVDAVDGTLQWHVQAAHDPLGAPVVFNHPGTRTRRVLLVSRSGEIAEVGAEGHLLRQARLPEDDYLPKPLLADVDEDGQPEILIATSSSALVVASLDGRVEQRVALRGAVAQGMVLADADHDGKLELFAATDCARVYCFATKATTGWLHPSGGAERNGWVPSFTRTYDLPRRTQAARNVRVTGITATGFSGKPGFSTGHVQLRKIPSGARWLAAAIRGGDTVVGAVLRRAESREFALPYARLSHESLSLDIALLDDEGQTLASIEQVTVRPEAVRLVELESPWGLLECVEQRAAQYAPPSEWKVPNIHGRTLWPVIRQEPEDAWRTYGLGAEPVIAAAARYSARSLQQPAAGTSFLPMSDTRPDRLALNRQTAALPHDLYRTGAPGVVACVGGNAPCTPRQLALLRGAARQCGLKPWGIAIDNHFIHASADTQYRGDSSYVSWQADGEAKGLDCGHSPSLLFRQATAAYLGGNTFTFLDSVFAAPFGSLASPASVLAQENRPSSFGLSAFGMAARQWYRFVRNQAERGTPYTPVAFLLGVGEGGHEAVNAAGPRAQDPVQAFLAHVWGCGRPNGDPLEFERGYMTQSPYGDVFDVISASAPLDAMGGYGVVWPLGSTPFDGDTRQSLMDYVRQGGILVLDAVLAEGFPKSFLGTRLLDEREWDVQIQTALGNLGRVGAPYEYRRIDPKRDAQVLAWTGSGAPLLVWRTYGDGVLVLSGSRRWVDARGDVLTLAPAVLRQLVDAFLPVQPASDVQMAVNYTKDGWLIGLVNNNGVRKTPTTPAAFDEEGACDCILSFKERPPLRFSSKMGDFRWNVTANGLHTRIPAGGAAVVEVTMPHGGQGAPGTGEEPELF